MPLGILWKYVKKKKKNPSFNHYTVQSTRGIIRVINRCALSVLWG